MSVTDGIQTTLHCVLADNVVNGACTCLRATLACSHPADDATCSAPTLTACCPGVDECDTQTMPSPVASEKVAGGGLLAQSIRMLAMRALQSGSGRRQSGCLQGSEALT